MQFLQIPAAHILPILQLLKPDFADSSPPGFSLSAGFGSRSNPRGKIPFSIKSCPMKTLLCCRPLPSRSCWSIPHRSCPGASTISYAQHRLLPDPCLRGSSLPSTSLRSSSLPGSPCLFDDWLAKSCFQAPASAFQIPVNRVTGQLVAGASKNISIIS